MGLRIGGGFGLGPVGVGAGFRVGGGRRSRSSGDDGGGLAFVLWLIAVVFAIIATIVFGFLAICFSIGFLVAHLAGSSGLKASNRRPWVSWILHCFGVLAVVYLVNRGELGSAWSNFDFGSSTEYEAGRRYENTLSDDWRLLFELGLWSFALGLMLATPAHWVICSRHHPNRRRQLRALGDGITKYWFVSVTALALIGIGISIWMRLVKGPDALWIVAIAMPCGLWLLGCLVVLLFAVFFWLLDKMKELKDSFL